MWILTDVGSLTADADVAAACFEREWGKNCIVYMQCFTSIMDAQQQFNSTKVFPFPAWEKYLLKTSINFLIALFKKSFGCDYALPGQILNRYDNEMESTKNSFVNCEVLVQSA